MTFYTFKTLYCSYSIVRVGFGHLKSSFRYALIRKLIVYSKDDKTN